MGFEYRITANEYYHKVFTYELNPYEAFNKPPMIPVLFLTRSLRSDFIIPTDVSDRKAVHVCILLPDAQVIDADYRNDLVHIRPIGDILLKAYNLDLMPEMRAASVDTLQDNSGKWVYGVDFDGE